MSGKSQKVDIPREEMILFYELWMGIKYYMVWYVSRIARIWS